MKRLNSGILCRCLLGFYFLMVLSVHAKDDAVEGRNPLSRWVSPDVVDSMTARQLYQIMQGEGYAVELGDNSVAWRIDGARSRVFVGRDGKSLQFYAGFEVSDDPMVRVNEWNRGRRFSRAYVSEQGSAALEADFNLTGGVTEDAIKHFLSLARVSFQLFIRQVVLNE